MNGSALHCLTEQTGWNPPPRLRIGPWWFSTALGPAGEPPQAHSEADGADQPCSSDAANCLVIRPYDSPPQMAAALHYPSWSAGQCRVQGRNFYCDIDFDGPRLTWWWPRRHWQSSAAALWDLSVLASTQALALHRGGLLMHGAAVVIDGQATIITGPSGAGKSTLAARFPGQVLHDDVIAIAPDPRAASGWAVWSQDGSRAPGGELPGEVPLERVAIFSTERSRTFAAPLDTAQALGELAAQTYFAGGEATGMLMSHLANLAAAVPLVRFGHCLDDERSKVEAVLRGEA